MLLAGGVCLAAFKLREGLVDNDLGAFLDRLVKGFGLSDNVFLR